MRAPVVQQSGLTYVEVLIALVLMVLIAGPLADTVATSLTSTKSNLEDTTRHYELLGVMEATLATDFGTLQARAATSPTGSWDEVTTAGERVILEALAYDIDNADGDGDFTTGTDDNVLFVRATLANTALVFESLKVR